MGIYFCRNFHLVAIMASKGRGEEHVRKCKRKLDLAKAALARETSEQHRLEKQVEDAFWYAERGQKAMKEATELYKELREIAKVKFDAYSAKVKLMDKLKNTVTRAVAAHRAAMFLEETEKYNEGILRKVRKAAQAKAVEAAGGYFCALWAKLGDLDYYATMMKLRHYAANIPCSWCREGESDAIPWNGFRPTASWIPTTYSPTCIASSSGLICIFLALYSQ